VTITLTNHNGANATPPGPFTADTNASGQTTATFTSNSAGTVTGSASWTGSVGGSASFSISTDGTSPSGDEATKVFQDAFIEISPDGVNEIGDEHTFTATVHVNYGDGGGFVLAPEGTEITFTSVDANGAVSTPNPPTSCTTVGTTGECTTTISSPSAGTTTVSASTTFTTPGGVELTRTTNGVGSNSEAALKQWVDARIAITPDGTNRVGDEHTFTATVWVNDGSGEELAPDGTEVTFTTVDANGAVSTPNPPTGCTTVGGECTTTISSSTTGTSTVSAHSTVNIDGVDVSRSTDGVAPNSDAAVKTWVDARINITPDAFNEIGDPHTFTATLEFDLGDGAGFQPAEGESVTITLTNHNGAVADPPGPFTADTNASGQTTATFVSGSPGTVTGSASWTGSVGGSASFSISTDGTSPSGDEATKVFQDAFIEISPDGVNEIGDEHTFTATVHVNYGDGGGFVLAPEGTEITFTSVDANGAVSTPNPPTSCTTVGTTGECTTTISSPSAGTTTVSASTTFTTPGGVELTRTTNGVGSNSEAALKQWVDARIAITPDGTNRVGDEHTFTATVWVNDGSGEELAPDGTEVTFTTVDANGAVSTPNPPTGCTTVGGECTTTISSSTTGTSTVSAHSTVNIDGVDVSRSTDGVAPNSDAAVKTWVDARINITPDAFNEIGDPHTFTATLEFDLGDGAGFQPAEGESVTITLTNHNGAVADPPGPFTADTNASGQTTATFVSGSPGTVTGSASWTGSVGGSASFSISTDGTSPSGDEATKVFQDAFIEISPDGVNEIGDEHTFTATVHVNYGDGGGFVLAPEGTEITFTSVDANGAVSTPNPPTSCTTVGTTGECTTTISSPSAGTTTVSASTTFTTPGGVELTRTTNGVGSNSEAALKQWVDARIAITPDGTNRVGDEHTFTATVWVNDGSGEELAPDGTEVTFTTVDANGAVSTPNPPTGCTTVGGECTTTISSSTTGTSTVSAHSTVNIDGVDVSRSTDGVAPNSDAAVKTWVDARINITPDAFNEIGDPHTFTATLEFDLGDGAGFQPAEGESVTITLTNHNGAVADPPGPFTADTNASGQTTATFVSGSPGTVTGSASWTGSVGGSASFSISTDGTSPSGDEATKVFQDAFIEISPDGVNEIGDEHTFTATVHVNYGDGGGFVLAPEGTEITFTSVDANGAVSTPNPPTSCTTVGTTGECTTTISSPSAGTTTVSASTTFTTPGGVELTRTTNGVGSNSEAALKQWVDARIAITPDGTNRVGDEHTFTATVWVNDGSGEELAPDGTEVTFTTVDANGAVSTPNPPTGCTTVGGECTTTISSSTTGTSTVSAHSTVNIDGVDVSRSTDGVAPNSDAAVKTWVDASIRIAPQSDTNAINTNHTFTITVEAHNGTLGNGTATAAIVSGPGSFVGSPSCNYTGGGATASCTVVITSAATGTTVVSATSNIPVSGESISRTTNPDGSAAGPAGSGNASKVWVDASIRIAPQNDTNAVNTNHTFTITVEAHNGTLGNGTATAAIVSGPGSFVGSPSCNYTGGGATASCTVVITSAATGTTVVSATSNIPVSGQSISRTTNPDGSAAGPAGSGNASKVWVNASIRITPDGLNPVNTTHTFTITVEAHNGTLGSGTATAAIVSGPGSFVGSPTCRCPSCPRSRRSRASCRPLRRRRRTRIIGRSGSSWPRPDQAPAGATENAPSLPEARRRPRPARSAGRPMRFGPSGWR
jgi:hypothetical protein